MSRVEEVAILGGGVAGVVLAQELAGDARFRVDLVERETRLGGLHRSVSAGGATYDIGAFAFESDHGLLHAFPGLRDVFVHTPYIRRSLTDKGTIDIYPLSLRGYVRDHGVRRLGSACLDLALSKVRHRRRDTLPAFVRYYLGDRMYRDSGLRNYIERFYGAREDEIDLEFARQRLEVMQRECSLRGNALRLLARLFARPAGPDPWRAWEAWVRPREGFDLVYRLIRDQLEARGVTVLTGRRIRAITRAGDGFAVEFDDQTRHYRRVISTIPVPAVLRYIGLPPRPGHALDCMTLASLFYRFRGDPGHDAVVLYNFTPDGSWKRLTMFSHLYGKADGDHYLTVECTLPHADGDSLAEQARGFEEHIARTPLFRGSFHYQGGAITEDAYPVYRKGKLLEIQEMRRTLSRWGIDAVGRQGRFEYTSASATAARSRQLAERIKSGQA
jgi:phytoene dehydrogenase-like protein